jgi:hypothetical protein
MVDKTVCYDGFLAFDLPGKSLEDIRKGRGRDYRHDFSQSHS